MKLLSWKGGRSLNGTKRYRLPDSKVRSIDVAVVGPDAWEPLTSTYEGIDPPFHIDSTLTRARRPPSEVETTMPTNTTGAALSSSFSGGGGHPPACGSVTAPHAED